MVLLRALGCGMSCDKDVTSSEFVSMGNILTLERYNNDFPIIFRHQSVTKCKYNNWNAGCGY